MKKYTQRGFTLIELLVVIAIIGILSSVVLASLSTARNKGKDAAIQGQMTSLRNAAEMYYSSSGKYQSGTTAIVACGATGSFFVDTTGSNAKAIMDAIATGSNGSVAYTDMTCTINDVGSAWAVTAKLPGAATWYCVDSAGVAKGGYANMAAALTNTSDYTCN